MNEPLPLVDEAPSVEKLMELVDDNFCRLESQADIDKARAEIEAMARRLAAPQAQLRDAARYQWLANLKCNSFSLSRDDDHAGNYVTAKQWIKDHPEDFADVDSIEVARMRETNTIWQLQIYWDTPVGSCVWRGATAAACVDAAMAPQQLNGKATGVEP